VIDFPGQAVEDVGGHSVLLECLKPVADGLEPIGCLVEFGSPGTSRRP